MLPVDQHQSTALEAAAFRRLVAHLQERTDVQNIDLMTLAGFCRNCLSRWLEEAARDAGLPLDREQARTHVYGMPAAEWKSRYGREATEDQQRAFSHAAHHTDEASAQPDEAGRPVGAASRQADA